jgi:CRP-like cAMP-binding protein
MPTQARGEKGGNTIKGRSGSAGEILEFLRGLPLFSKLDESSVRGLAQASKFCQLDKGEILFFQSDPSDAVYVVRSGRISIVLDSPDGREMVIDEMRAGEILGELGPLTKRVRSAGAMARSNSELLMIPREAFLVAMDHDPRMARQLLDITAGRLHMSARRELALAFMNAQARLARHLLALEEEEHDKGYVTASQEDLARGTGLIRQTVAKALGRWRRDGWLLTGRGRIVILNRKALEQVEGGEIELTLLSPK